MVKVLIVDDSIFMCKALSRILEKDPDIKVVGVANDGEDGVKKVKELDPDIVTMDVEMPKMDGLTALGIIMKESPRPVLMVSSLTKEGAETTVKALSLGAVDFIPKELYHSDVAGINLDKIEKQLLEKVKAIAAKKGTISRISSKFSSSLSSSTSAPTAEKPAEVSIKRAFSGVAKADIVAIGVSTGGPTALQSILPLLPDNLPVPIVVVQHMPAAFTAALADRLNSLSKITVKEVSDGEKLKAGYAYIVPGAFHLQVKRSGGPVASLSEEPKDSVYRPCIDITFSSIADAFGGRSLAVMLTGMGHDGLKGAKAIKNQGGRLIAQDEATSVVYGMPKAVAEAGIVDKVVPLDKIAQEIVNAL